MVDLSEQVMLSRKRLATLVFTLGNMFLSCVHGLAQDQSDTARNMEEVVVTATRHSAQASRLPYTVNILTRKDAERQASRTVPESLSGIPGLFIQKTNHAGGSPFLRGLTGNQTLIMVDGIRLNNSVFRYGPNQYMTLIEPEIVERIEVVKGTGSVQYGSDALTGVINIFTTELQFRQQSKWKEKVLTRLSTSGMEYTLRPEVRFEGKRFAFVAGASGKKFGDLAGGDTTGFQRPSGYQEGSFDLKAMADLGHQWVLTAAMHYLRQQDVPVYHKYVLEDFAVNDSDPIERGFAYIRLEKPIMKSYSGKLSMFANVQQVDEERYLRKRTSRVLRVEDDRVSTASSGADLFLQIAERWKANTGIEVYVDKVRSSRVDTHLDNGTTTSLRGLYPNASKYLNAALYNLHHLDFGRLQIEGGLRYNLYRAAITDATLGKVSLAPSALVFQGGVNYRIGTSFFLYTHASEGFRAPNIDDMGTLGIVDFRYEVPAYDLSPEKSLNMEFGMKYVTPTFNGYAAVFRSGLRDLITRVKTGEVISGYDVYQKENVDRGVIRGFEAMADYRPFKGWRFTGSAAMTHGQSITRDEPLRRMPPFNSRLSAEYGKGGFRAGVLYDHADPQRRLEAGDKSDNRIPQGGTPGYNVLHLFGSCHFGVATIRVYLNNLLHQDYRTHGSGINGMGRSATFAAVFDF